MANLKRVVARIPVLGRVLLMILRVRNPLGHCAREARDSITWLFKSREITNFTYDLTPANERYLASLLADITGTDFEQVFDYMTEVANDQALQNHILSMTSKSDLAFIADQEVRFARRLGWYALIRIVKPKVVIETGVDKGLGACLITSALAKNSDEGSPGEYFGTDINPEAGYLLSGKYAEFGRILYGDSIEQLEQLHVPIDLFINDSDHSSEYEAKEYDVVADKLSPNAIILGDNAHRTDKLLEFSLKRGRRFIYFQEEPNGHWYPGAGIGISFVR